EVESKKVDMVTQHMWGDYQFDKAGNIISRSKGNAQLAQHGANKEIEGLTTLRKKMIQGNGGLSSAQEIFIDAMQAKA
ncbi:Mbeg1-like protein, partial [Enterococcus faecalis]